MHTFTSHDDSPDDDYDVPPTPKLAVGSPSNVMPTPTPRVSKSKVCLSANKLLLHLNLIIGSCWFT